MKVLIIEDDYRIVEAISLSFQVGWPNTNIISTKLGEEGIVLVEKESPDIVVLDLGLPDIDGFEVLKGIRLFSNVPVIILTVRSDEVDIVKGLEWGADDYLTKPYKQLELLARVKSILKKQNMSRGELHIYCSSFSLDITKRKVMYCGRENFLTNNEAMILRILMINAEHFVSHFSIIQGIWDNSCPGAIEAIRVYIRHLRQKIEPNPNKPQFILTKPGGYLFTVNN
ncbi:MAG: response regulator transcription factor [Candidatus Hodarchaeales archaeon]